MCHAVVILGQVHPGVDRVLSLTVAGVAHAATPAAGVKELGHVRHSPEVRRGARSEKFPETAVRTRGRRGDGVVAELEAPGLLVVVDEHHALACAKFHLAHVDGRKEVLEGDGGKLLVWCVAEVVEHHQRRREERVGGRARVALRRRHLSRQSILMDTKRQGGAPRRAADLQILAALSGGEDHEVRDPQRARHLNEILELVCLGLLEVACGVRLHHVAHVLAQLGD
mmetsp:Transcript_10745/g.17239  ORF Transcript_10745/g.17239 Transcript_10745/m.17239 type:complete len:226 (+) Transcript_10745:859-1536(+)